MFPDIAAHPRVLTALAVRSLFRYDRKEVIAYMRRLFLLRGAPASGKTTWVRDNGLAPYTISSDDVRLMISAPIYDIDGKLSIPQTETTEVWQFINRAISERMARGELVVLDATNLKSEDMRAYKNMASDNRYIVYVVDFTEVPEEVCLERNALRDPLRRVPDEVIEKFCSQVRYQAIPSGYKIVTPDEALSLIDECEPYDLSDYKALNLFGDIHGCHTALMDMLSELGCENGQLKNDEFYIFCGDYIDRGLENVETVKYLMSVVDRDNVMMLEGNHEKWLDDWAHDREAKSKTFRSVTSSELDASDIDKKDVSRFYRRLIPAAWLRSPNGELVYVCHGGIPTFPRPYMGISCQQLIKGVGGYREADDVNACWEETSGQDGIYLVHGHRNGKCTDVRPFEHVFSLEGAVEHGGELRCARFEKECEPATIRVANSKFNKVSSDINLEDVCFEDAVENLRANPQIKEKVLANGVSSFNFTREAFNKRVWNSQTIKARGLFLDMENDFILARSYDKFFAIGEQQEVDEIAQSFTYPVSVYRKENGYLGIAAPLGDGKLFFASKTTDRGDYASEFRSLAIKTLGGSISKFADYLEDIDASAVFEVIVPAFDRHIIEYDRPQIVLLDIIYNDFAFGHIEYDELCSIASRFKLDVKEKVCEFDTKRQLIEWYSEVSATGYVPSDGVQVEGYVLCDSDDRMVKVKCDWYRYWKCIRGMIHDVMRRGRSTRPQVLVTTHPEVERFYEWLKDYIRRWKSEGNREDPAVIDVRNEWERYLASEQ